MSLILALFAIALSVAFYFKSTDTSNLFYDNTYKFTKEISEILGRIEAGFGERLRHLDEGYSGLANKIDNNSSEKNILETKEEIEKEKQKLKNEIEERDKILNSLIEKSQLEQHEKEEIRKQLKEREIEISKQKREIGFLRNSLHNETENEETNFEDLPVSILQILYEYTRSLKEPKIFLKYPISMLSRRFRLNVKEILPQDLSLILNHRIINEDGSFTVRGIKIVRQIINRM